MCGNIEFRLKYWYNYIVLLGAISRKVFIMKLRKIAAAVLSLTLMCGAVPFSNVLVNDSAVYAEEEYTEGTYGVLTYKNYGDYIEISDCDESATKVEIPSEIDGVPVTSIGYEAFKYCYDISSVIIPDSIISISDFAFHGCQSLKSIAIPESVTSIGNGAFCYCDLLESVSIPDSITIISDNLFRYCSSLTSITIPDSVTSIAFRAFSDCTSLTSIIIPNSVTSIGFYAFEACPSITSIILPDSVNSIGCAAFANCESLKSVTIKNPDCEIDDAYYTFSNGFDSTIDEHYYFNGTIYGYENSTAQAYAEKYNRNFVSLGEYVEIETILGDIDGDGVINSSDASNVLAAYALIATGGDSPFTDEQMKAADVNKDGAVDSSDASSILAYYAYTATGGTGTLEEFLG